MSPEAMDTEEMDAQTANRDVVASLGTILGVWAHPDDEAYLSAGLMALARRAGNRVVCVTATRGEHGTPDPTTWPPERLARIREREMSASLAALGVDEHRWLDYEDGTCDRVSDAEGAGHIVSLFYEIRPDTVITFGPDGMTGHADHRAVSRWTTLAWKATAAARTRLFYATKTPEFTERFWSLHASLQVFEPGFPTTTPEADLSLHLELDDETVDQKYAALRAQASQTAGLIELIGEDQYAEWWHEESFVSPADWPAQPGSDRRARRPPTIAAA